MSLQLTMINNRRHATPIKVKSPKLVTRLYLYWGKVRLLYILCRFCNLVWKAPIAFLSSFRKHLYLFQGPNSTKMHSGITPLNIRPFSIKRIILICSKDYEIQCKHLSSIITETHLLPAFWLSGFLRPSALRFTNYSYAQIKTKNQLKSQVSHLKVQKPIPS